MYAFSAGYPKVIFERRGVEQKENRNEKSSFKDGDNRVLELSLAARIGLSVMRSEGQQGLCLFNKRIHVLELERMHSPSQLLASLN
jgi:hypothetical protein